jgi:hypothetical protein
MKRFLTFVLLLGSIFCKAQTASPIVNKSKIQSCCDSLRPYFVPGNYTDTISYDNLITANGYLYVIPEDPSAPSRTEVQSYEMKINNGKTLKIGLRSYNFSKVEELKQGGTITITNCKVKCWVDDKKPKEPTNTISKFVFHILPSKNKSIKQLH